MALLAAVNDIKALEKELHLRGNSNGTRNLWVVFAALCDQLFFLMTMKGVGKKKSEPFLRVHFTLTQREQTARAARGQCEHPPLLCASTPPCSARGAGSLWARLRVALRKGQGRSARGSASKNARVSLQKREGHASVPMNFVK